MVKFIATYIDNLSNEGDSLPHVMGIYDSEEDALEEISEDIDEFWNSLEENEQYEVIFDNEHMKISYGNQFICWNVEVIEF